MAEWSDKTILCYDHGLFVELARMLGKEFGRCLYYTNWENGYPCSNSLMIGEGIEGVERVSSIWPYVPEVDVFFFPDVYEGALQSHLASLGKRVWGCKLGEELELDRIASKEFQASLGIDIGPYEVVKGIDALRKFLKENEEQYVKVSATRGDFESFRAKNYKLIEPRLDELEHRLGAKKKIMQFIVEEAIDPAVEVGYDGYTIDGQFPQNALYGIEVKDEGYVGRTKKYDDLPKEVTGVNEKLAPALKDYQYRGFFSTELRITPDRKAYSIDPCARCGSPPNELYQMMIDNLAEIIWHGSNGELVEPKYNAKWGAELLIHSSWAERNWQAIEFPEEIRENVKLRNLCVIDGKYYVAPDSSGVPEIGAVVATGNTMKEAVEECKRIAELVEGHWVEVKPDALSKANEEIEELEEFGIEF